MANKTLLDAAAKTPTTSGGTFGGGSFGGTGAGDSGAAKVADSGAFSSKQGGYVTTTGQTYPTNNPNFVPNQNNGQVKFNKDGTVTYSEAGKSINYTHKEWQGILGQGGGFVDANTQAYGKFPQMAQQEKLTALQQKQTAEMQSLANTDFTKLGQDQQQQAEKPNKSVGDFLQFAATGNSPSVEAQRNGQPAPQIVGGSLPIVPAAALAGTGAAFVALSGKAKTALIDFKALKVVGVAAGGITYFTKNKVNTLEGDIGDLVSYSRDLTSSVKSGADPVEVRAQLIDMEHEIRNKIGELNTAKKYSIADRIAGADTQTYAQKQLAKIILRRQAIERYMIDQNINALDSSLGVASIEG